ncbi:MAG: DGQHR domain-containing protein [Rhodobacteraceae bacterium]|nr:DGQHR domain-containing protein [Paracoccaceae bacterium]
MPKDSVPVLRLKQWIDSWDNYQYEESAQRRKPEPYIFVFAMSASKLRSYSDVYQRNRSPQEVSGIQRGREESRINRIRRFIQEGYPYSDLKENQHSNYEYLRKPGWLPTSIVINILTEKDVRREKTINSRHMVKLQDEENGNYSIKLPDEQSFKDTDLRPFEVIDGQHRLWAFEENKEFPNFEVPVVAFHGLDLGWQAYLFWSINISPVRINPSHAFDLYPLLRSQDWLESRGDITVYREARAQEITEWLYKHQKSPWYNRISMLQRRGEARVSQAAWVRSLVTTFFGKGRGGGKNGLYQCQLVNNNILEWVRVQQISFIMEFWNLIKLHLEDSNSDWIIQYKEKYKDPFTDKSSMLNQDMGIKAIHSVLNNHFYNHAVEWKLNEWQFSAENKTLTSENGINEAVESLKNCEFHDYLDKLAHSISEFDWRSVDGPGVKGSGIEMIKRAYRGSGGYTLLTNSLLEHVSQCNK